MSRRIQGKIWLKIVWYLISSDWDFMVIMLMHVLVFYVVIILLECSRAWFKTTMFSNTICCGDGVPSTQGEIEGFLEMGGILLREQRCSGQALSAAWELIFQAALWTPEWKQSPRLTECAQVFFFLALKKLHLQFYGVKAFLCQKLRRQMFLCWVENC